MARTSGGSKNSKLQRQRKARRTRRQASARTREAARLREAATNLETLLEHMSDGIMVFGPDFRWQLYNRNLCELQRFPPEIGHIGAHGEDAIAAPWRR